MHEDKEIERDRDHNNQPFLWYLPGTKYPQNFFLRQHELDCADLFVAYFQSGQLSHWDSEWGSYERERLNIPAFRIEYDRRMVIGGRVFLIEVDRGTEDLDDKLEPKVDKYIQFSRAYPGTRFHVLFTLQKYRRMNLKNRAELLLAMLAEKERGNQFLVGYHEMVKKDPLGKVWVSPKDPSRLISLRDV